MAGGSCHENGGFRGSIAEAFSVSLMRILRGLSFLVPILSLCAGSPARAQQPNRPSQPMPNIGPETLPQRPLFPERQERRQFEAPRVMHRPAPRVENLPPPPRPGVAWRRGYWAWRQPQWLWVEGVWLDGAIPPMPDDLAEGPPPPPSDDAYWAPGHWEWSDGQGWVWVPGTWYQF